MLAIFGAFLEKYLNSKNPFNPVLDEPKSVKFLPKSSGNEEI